MFTDLLTNPTSTMDQTKIKVELEKAFTYRELTDLAHSHIGDFMGVVSTLANEIIQDIGSESLELANGNGPRNAQHYAEGASRILKMAGLLQTLQVIYSQAGTTEENVRKLRQILGMPDEEVEIETNLD